MPADNKLKAFGFVYGQSGTARGTTTSSGVLTVPTFFGNRVVYAIASSSLNGLRNNNADPAANTGVGTFVWCRQITVNPTNPTTARFRVYRSATISAASAVTTLSRKETLATAITAVQVDWLAFGY